MERIIEQVRSALKASGINFDDGCVVIVVPATAKRAPNPSNTWKLEPPGTLTVGGKSFSMPPTAFRLLEYMQDQTKPVPTHRIVDHLWGHDSERYCHHLKDPQTQANRTLTEAKATRFLTPKPGDVLAVK